MASQGIDREYLCDTADGDDAIAAWSWLCDHTEPYPPGSPSTPMQPSKRVETARRLVALEIELDDRESSLDPVPVALRIVRDGAVACYPLPDDATGAASLAGFLFTRRDRGMFYCVWGGASMSFHVILRHWAHGLCALGYRITPIAAGTEIKALIIQRDHASWTLVDPVTMLGLGQDGRDAFVQSFAPGGLSSLDPLLSLQSALDAVQDWFIQRLGVAPHLTIASTALAALRRSFRDDAWVWRPLPLAVALCRAGGAFRGGYQFSRHYLGPGWQVDVNRMYTWALQSPVPIRLALADSHGPDGTRPGLYLARYEAQTELPVYLARWGGPVAGFHRSYLRDGSGLCLVHTSELPGLRRMGCRVETLHGLAYTVYGDLSGYVSLLSKQYVDYPRGSAQSRIAKMLGNSVYGKLSERPERTELVYSLERPGDGWWPYLDCAGDELDGVWWRSAVHHRPHQRVDIGAEITARARSRIYSALQDAMDAECTVIAAHTDSFVAEGDMYSAVQFAPDELGGWRLVGVSDRVISVGMGRYSVGRDAHVRGVFHANAEMLEEVYAGREVVVSGRRLHRPGLDGPVQADVKVRVR